jgi:hypothetical protein
MVTFLVNCNEQFYNISEVIAFLFSLQTLPVSAKLKLANQFTYFRSEKGMHTWLAENQL